MISDTKRKGASVVVALAILMATASSTFALDITNYLPYAAGNQWSYVNTSNATMSQTMGSSVMLPSGVSAIPWTSVDSSQSGYTVTYNTIDANGFRKHQEYMSSVDVPGYGNTTATAVYSPALSVVPANVSVGSTYTSTGAVTLAYTNVTTVTLNCSCSSQVVGFETVSSNDSTQTWSALKLISSITLSGTINGKFTSITSSLTIWLVDGLGVVKLYRPNVSLQMETWKLTSTNVVAPTTTTTTTKPPTTTTTTKAPTTTTTTKVPATTTTKAPATTTTTIPDETAIQLFSGWNLVGLKGGEAVQVESLVAAHKNEIESVWKWVNPNDPDATSSAGTWSVYLPNDPYGGASYAQDKGFSVLSTINFGEGFWANSTSAVNLP